MTPPPSGPSARRPSHAEIVRLLEEGGEDSADQIMEYLKTIAESYSVDEVFAVMALVDTPDVFG